MANLYRKFVGASIGTALSFTVINVNAVQAANFTFTKIADVQGTLGTIGSIDRSPVILEDGTVAFFAQLDGIENSNSVYLGDGSSPIPILRPSALSLPIDAFDINNNSTIAFLSRPDNMGSISRISTINGDVRTTIALTQQTDSSSPFKALGEPYINDNGTVLFSAQLETGDPNDFTNYGIFINKGGLITTIALNKEANPSSPFSDVIAIGINNNDTVVFFAGLEEGIGVFTSSGGIITTIAQTSDSLDPGNSGLTAINNSGTVVFGGLLNGKEGIFTSRGGAISTVAIADTTSPFKGFDESGSAINDSGTVVFRAFLDLNTGDKGIFVNSDSVTEKVITTGDSLFGSTVAELEFFNRGLNNVGQIAFFAQLADGTEVIVRADPVSEPPPKSVPEPSSIIGLLVFSAFGAVSTLKKRMAFSISLKHLIT